MGLGKKVLLSNQLAVVADRAFGLGDGLSASFAWLGALCYTLQIYYDFSGYSDMAIGLGKMFGFHFLENFNYPYISRSITEFWRRWHISLSTWFRDYVYFPLGGSRVNSKAKHIRQPVRGVAAHRRLARGPTGRSWPGDCSTSCCWCWKNMVVLAGAGRCGPNGCLPS